MDIKYIGIPSANIEGRYNEIKYFIEKILSFESTFLSTLHIDRIVYGSTDEFDSIKVVPYERGVVFEINNVADETEYSNNTEAKLIVSDDKVYFVITKADWNHNRSPEVEQQAAANTEMANSLINSLGLKLDTDRIEPFEKSKDWLINFSQRRQEKIQKKAYSDIMSKIFSKLKEALNLFETDESLNMMETEQENLKQVSDQKELFKKQLDSISDEKMEVLYKYSNGDIDKMSAIKLINQINDRTEQPKVSEEDLKNLLDYVIQGNILDKDDSEE